MVTQSKASLNKWLSIKYGINLHVCSGSSQSGAEFLTEQRSKNGQIPGGNQSPFFSIDSIKSLFERLITLKA